MLLGARDVVLGPAAARLVTQARSGRFKQDSGLNFQTLIFVLVHFLHML